MAKSREHEEGSSRASLVTGAGRGIGKGIALALAERGWTVVVNYCSNAEAASETLRVVKESGGEGIALQADVSDAAERERLVNETLERFGRIDLLVNNAGVATAKRTDILELGEDSYEGVMATNLSGPFFLTQAVAKVMIGLVKSGVVKQPKIINVGSISAYTSSVNRAEYCISKAGIAMMTVLYADRLAEYGINVYEVRPGVIETDMTEPVKQKYDRLIAGGLTPIRRWGKPEDVARAVVAIAEGWFPFSTGEVINVDGGFHLHRL